MIHRNALLGGAVLWLTACGVPLVGEADLKTDQQTYAPGSKVKLLLRNDSLQLLGYNLCMSSLQRDEGGTWTVVPPPGRQLCAAIQYNIWPGESGESLRPLPETLPEGTYRYVTNVDWNGEHQEVASNAFSVAHAE
ncbi:immunoglobulin-like domain-containing protein [Archangium sp. Cb G35]|uniref:immunoglobulin-like domain-containing protein n=1 Tax=Archangium sp. Cb G35 TaxID=1920190 RepID=UPI000A48F475|nr:immunoglobulin-like domain-containing protein [Archangium sp. Cb G35]